MSRPFTRRAIVKPLLASCVALALVSAAIGQDKKKAKDADATVTMKRMQFVPEEVTIKKGQTVQWINNDDRDYLIVADDQSWKSDNLRPKETFEHTFKEAGTFGYKNMLRPRSTGTITVTE